MFQPADVTVAIDDDTDWRHAALCQQFDIDLFFPEKGGSTADAKRICGMCDVATECLAYALAFERGHSGEIHGVWGGLSSRERRRIVNGGPRSRPVADCPHCDKRDLLNLALHVAKKHTSLTAGAA